MSFNQSRPNDSVQHRSKSGRSAGYNHHRANPGGYGKGGPPAPSPSLSSAAGSWSFKKPGNVQGGQSRVSFPSANHHAESTNASAQPIMPGGASALPQARGGSSNAPVTGTTSKTAETAPAPSKGAQTVPKAPASSPANTGPDAATPATPVKGPGDQSKGFPFQFGSITPSFVNGMQVPARTSSAPPNIDEQKRDQARNNPVKSVPPVPIPPARQQLPRKDMGSSNNLSSADVQSNPKTRKETQAQSVGPGAQAQKPQVHQVHRTPMPITYQQPQVSMKYNAPNPLIQSQGLASASIQMQMPIPISRPVANAPLQVQPQYFLPSIPPHQMPPQGQGLSFAQVPHLGNFGMGIGQYPQQQGGQHSQQQGGQHSQQQGGQFGGPRKSFVKITHPETHQEVRLDKPSDALPDGGPPGKSHPNAPPQSQPMTSYLPAHQSGYYPNYPTGTMFFPGPGSLPVAGGQINPVPQVPIFNYLGSQGPQNTSFMNPQANNLVAASRTGVSKQGTPEQSRQERAQISRDGTSFTSSVTREVVEQGDVSTARNAAGISSVRSSSATIKIEPPKPRSFVESHVKESDVGPGSSSKPGTTKGPTVSSSLIAEYNSARASVSCENLQTNTSSNEGRTHEVSALTEHDAEAVKKESYSRSNSMMNCDEKHGKIDGVSQPPVEQQDPSTSSLPIHATVPGDVNEGLEAEAVSIFGSGNGVTSESAMECRTGPDSTSSSNQRISSIGNDPGLFTPETTDAAPSVKPAEPCPQRVDELDRKNAQAEEGSVEDVNGMKGSDDSAPNSGLFPAKSSEEAHEQETMVEASVESISEVPHEKSDPHEGLRNVDTEISGSLSADVSVRESVPCPVMPLPDSHSNDISSLSVSERGDGTDIYTLEIQEMARTEDDVQDKSTSKGASTHISSSIDKPLPELNRPKSATSKGKKKRRELLQKADAAGSTLDLYMAYKGPEEKKETMVSSASEEISSPQTHSKSELAGSRSEEVAPNDESEENKAAPDDWEDAADISTPELESSDDNNPVGHPEDDICTAKKYSRDFLLKFEKQFTSLPENFQVTSDIADAFTPGVNISRSVGRDHHPNSGRPSTGPRLDRRGSNVREDDRWAKVQGAFASGHDLRLDIGLGGNSGFRPAQGANYGVLRTPRAQSPNQYPGSILPGLMQAPGSQGVMPRTGSDADRWQRASNFQKGLMPSPQTPLQVMHKAEKKYEVGKVTDDEQAKQRQLKAILNKLTPQNFEKLFEQVIAVQIDNATTLTGLISQIFDKALMEPTFCEMYAKLCSHLSQPLPDFNEGNEKITFKRVLLNKCQEEFERGEREQEEANKADEEGEVKLTEEQREEKRVKARRRMLGNIRLIGELYKKRMLTEKIMHECMKKLLGQNLTQTPDEEDLEAFCKLMSTIGEMIDHPKAKTHMDAYFDRMTSLSNNMDLSSRVRFMLKDSIDLRRNHWQQRRKVEGPKKIDEVHRDAQQERHGQAGRLGRAPGLSNSGRRGQQMEFTSRGNPLSSPNAQMGSFRGLPSQTRGFGPQDARFEERPVYEPRTLSVPLSHRSVGDDAITLGPQGGLGRGMSGRGPSSVLGSAFPDGSSSALDDRRTAGGLNGFSSIDRTNSYGSREDSAMRSAGDRYTGPDFNVQGGIEVRSPRYSSDRPSSRGDRPSSRGDRPSSRGERPSSRGERPTSRGNATAVTHNALPEKVLLEEKLRDMSVAAIKEYYGAKDEKEVVLCIKELTSPSFYSSVVSHWVTNSFEQKDMERDLLAKLLINLSKPEGGMLNRIQIVEGFALVLTTLEDAVNDAPKAPEYLGRLFGKVIVENVVSLGEIGRILLEGCEEKGQLLEGGLAADVLGCTLEAIQSDRGEVALNEIRRSSNLHLQDFRPPAPMKSRMLEKFI